MHNLMDIVSDYKDELQNNFEDLSSQMQRRIKLLKSKISQNKIELEIEMARYLEEVHDKLFDFRNEILEIVKIFIKIIH